MAGECRRCPDLNAGDVVMGRMIDPRLVRAAPLFAEYREQVQELLDYRDGVQAAVAALVRAVETFAVHDYVEKHLEALVDAVWP
jgi:hypothetical protein